jgi:hypothetical protein
MNLILIYAYVLTSPAIYYYDYVDDTYGKACIVRVCVCMIWHFLIQLEAFRIQNLLRMHIGTV